MTSEAQLLAARSLGVDRVTAEVVPAIEASGIPTIVLKGPSIARLIYPEGGRSYGDTDLLVPPAGFEPAAEVVRRLGFRDLLEGFHPLERDDHPSVIAFVRTCTPSRGPSESVDLHRNLPQLPTSEDLLWATLSADTEVMTVGGTTVTVLRTAGVALHVVLHAVQHAFELHTDEDLNRAIQYLTLEDWAAAADLANRLGIADVLGFGLRRYPGGARVADELNLPQMAISDSPYRWRDHPRGTYALSVLRSTPTVTAKVRWVRWTLVPSRAKIRYRSGQEGARGWRLLRGYLEWWAGLGSSLMPAVRSAIRSRQ